MKVFNLCCSLGHRFEGWFASDAERQRQLSDGLLVCPVCTDSDVRVLPSAPHVQTGRSNDAAPRATDVHPETCPAVAADQSGVQEWMQALRQVIANTDDVGDRFAEEARRIHYGETPERSIRGSATLDETRALRDEGIDVIPIGLPEALKGPMQ